MLPASTLSVPPRAFTATISLASEQWRRYVEAQRRVPPLGKKENNFGGEKEIRKIFLVAKKVPLDILVFV